MRIESGPAAEIAAGLATQEPVQQAVSIAVLKESLQATGEMIRQMLQSALPHLGRHIDLRA